MVMEEETTTVGPEDAEVEQLLDEEAEEWPEEVELDDEEDDEEDIPEDE